MKLPKLHLACANDEYRKSMHYIEFDGVCAFATDAFILTRWDYVNADQVTILNPEFTEGKYMHKKEWEILSKCPGPYEATEEGIIAAGKIMFMFAEPPGKFPKWDHILNFDFSQLMGDGIFCYNHGLFETVSRIYGFDRKLSVCCMVVKDGTKNAILLIPQSKHGPEWLIYAMQSPRSEVLTIPSDSRLFKKAI